MKAAIFHIRDAKWLHRFPGDFPQLRWSVHTSLESLAPAIADADILLLTNRASSPALGKLLRDGAKKLKWMHYLTAGMDRGIAMGLPEGVRVSYAAGVRAPMVAEHAFALLLALVRRLPDIAAAQAAHRWRRDEISARMASLNGATVCIAGLGAVGRELAVKLRAFHAHPIAISRSRERPPEIDVLYGRDEITNALANADALVICTQADESSFGMIGADAFAAMKPGAVLVNVARGSIVDEAAMIAALRTGRLGGAGLDVVAEEPLAEDSPLWDMPHVIVSPHSAGTGASSYDRHRALFGENLARFGARRALINEYRPAKKAQYGHI